MQKTVLAFPLVFAFAMWGLASDADEPSTADAEILFSRRISPILREKCLGCHGSEPDSIEGSLDLRSLSGLMAGGESGDPSLVPGNATDSPLFLSASRESDDWSEMPPKESERLSVEELNWLRDWIDAGAPWPDEEQIKKIQDQYAEGEQVLTSKALSDDWQFRRYEAHKLWAYRPLHVENVPENEHPVDWFINRKLLDANLAPAPSAESSKLARRISFGLTGLPPKPSETAAFLSAFADNPESAVRDFVSKLMQSPHYGEHFGTHWLDVARYADSAGFANDFSRPNAWRYRDYVVRAFNNDKPYNDFVREQIAGDEIDAKDPEKLIATGFLRMGPWEQTGMSVFKETRQQWLDDVTDSVGQAFLGHAMQCCKCHDHKFDPVPTRDYYSMMAVFSTTQLTERDAALLEVECRTGFKESDEWVTAKIDSYSRQQAELKKRVDKQRKQESGEAKVGDNGLDPGDEASLARMNKNISRHQWELDRTKPIALSVYTGNTILRKNVTAPTPLPSNPWGKGEMDPDTILAGGSVYSPADPVSPGELSAAESLGGFETQSFPGGKGKRRLALAEWIANPRNPLTARVMVNRVWSWHFGKGLAANPNNFGGTGGIPTHPELLDYLAAWFMQHDWSVKQLNELILSSDAYRRSTIHPDPKFETELDPSKHLYATFVPRRLTAEELRDAMLLASGELNRQVGGVPSRPSMNFEVAFQPRQIMGGTASVYEPDPLPQQRNRRSLYAEKLRGLRDPFLESFNQPGPDKSCELRETSTVATQALTLFNSDEVLDRAYGLAIRVVKEDLDDDGAINRAFELALGRLPSDHEKSICAKHWADATEDESKKTYEIKTYPTKINRTVMAEKTGEPYSFEEEMPAYQRYQPDVQPAKLDAKTRGLAQVCLVLFNLNEFAYLD
ncbi:PSD1 and planctomycete cytochrome C domain-containing protein [Rubripirellula reticaptiva]|uniref:Planctomycete cytochrome C n=1 Tax=Rubripirellula reticaptiva TaxID=2528013 RepID=A0A5C6ECJ1_9BACT|nr:PSD1 and planctomycete cytochrome C domain-containing protein [Rubripirellula reticaptiva]TWU46722.1 Planctomycete cytochrome C [Rubripirellula reticaptiva]